MDLVKSEWRLIARLEWPPLASADFTGGQKQSPINMLPGNRTATDARPRQTPGSLLQWTANTRSARKKLQITALLSHAFPTSCISATDNQFDVIYSGYMPDMSVSSPDFCLATTNPTMAGAKNHGDGHATEKEACEDDLNCRRWQGRNGEAIAQERSCRTICRNESDFCKTTAEATSSDHFTSEDGHHVQD